MITINEQYKNKLLFNEVMKELKSKSAEEWIPSYRKKVLQEAIWEERFIDRNLFIENFLYIIYLVKQIYSYCKV
jgi:hypothetical protein